MAPTRLEISPSPSLSTSAISNASSSEHNSEQDTDQHFPRKRRRLSPNNEDSDPETTIPTFSATSRIKRPKNPITDAHPGDLEKPAVSNGKSVDASLSFASLGAAPWLIASLANMAITRPTAIQKGCIPKILEGRDVIGGSKTGSGKTVAFTVPLLQIWAEDPVGIFAVVLTPTRYVVSDMNKPD